MRIAAFAPALSAKCGLPSIQVEAILTSAFEIIEELEAEGLVRIHTDVGVVCGDSGALALRAHASSSDTKAPRTDTKNSPQPK